MTEKPQRCWSIEVNYIHRHHHINTLTWPRLHMQTWDVLQDSRIDDCLKHWCALKIYRIYGPDSRSSQYWMRNFLKDECGLGEAADKKSSNHKAWPLVARYVVQYIKAAQRKEKQQWVSRATIFSSFLPCVLCCLVLLWATVIARFSHLCSILFWCLLVQGQPVSLHSWNVICVLWWRKRDFIETIFLIIIYLTLLSETIQEKRKNHQKFCRFLSSVNCIPSRTVCTERTYQQPQSGSGACGGIAMKRIPSFQK